MHKRLIAYLVLLTFLVSTVAPYGRSYATESLISLPTPGSMVSLSPTYEPVLIKGLTVHKDNPFLFDFVVDTGNSNLTSKEQQLRTESDRLIKYFFACLTIPEKDLWVNLSPYEKDRMVPEALGKTALGRDLLAEDYILKQISASLIYPEKGLGKEFWNRVYTKAQQMYGTSEVPMNTFNKIWILADKATVYEHGQTAFVVGGHLKVMLEQDYLAMSKHANVGVAEPGAPHRAQPASTMGKGEGQDPNSNSIGSQIVRDIVLPEIEKEVNTGKNFAPLRQIFNSLILATWYKKNLKEALLNQVYADKSTVKGVNLDDPSAKEEIYQQYLKAYKKGVFNFIKEDVQPDGQKIPRKYFSGGFGANVQLDESHDLAMAREIHVQPTAIDVSVAANANTAMSKPESKTTIADVLNLAKGFLVCKNLDYFLRQAEQRGVVEHSDLGSGGLEHFIQARYQSRAEFDLSKALKEAQERFHEISLEKRHHLEDLALELEYINPEPMADPLRQMLDPARAEQLFELMHSKKDYDGFIRASDFNEILQQVIGASSAMASSVSQAQFDILKTRLAKVGSPGIGEKFRDVKGAFNKDRLFDYVFIDQRGAALTRYLQGQLQGRALASKNAWVSKGELNAQAVILDPQMNALSWQEVEAMDLRAAHFVMDKATGGIYVFVVPSAAMASKKQAAKKSKDEEPKTKATKSANDVVVWTKKDEERWLRGWDQWAAQREKEKGQSAAMSNDRLATRFSNGKPIRLIFSDLTGTLAKVKRLPSGQIQGEELLSGLKEELERRLRSGSVLVIVTGDRFKDAKEWVIDQLSDDVKSNILVMSQSGMLGHRYQAGQWIEFQNVAQFPQGSLQALHWEDYKKEIIQIAKETALEFLGEAVSETLDTDGTVSLKYQKGSIMIRSHQLAFSFEKDKFDGDMEGHRQEMLASMKKNIEFKSGVFGQWGFPGTSPMPAGDVYIDLTFVPGFNKKQGLQRLKQTKILESLLGVDNIPWGESMGIGDSLRGNDGPMGEFLNEKKDSHVVSVGEADHKSTALPGYILKFQGQFGPSGVWHALTPAGSSTARTVELNFISRAIERAINAALEIAKTKQRLIDGIRRRAGLIQQETRITEQEGQRAVANIDDQESTMVLERSEATTPLFSDLKIWLQSKMPQIKIESWGALKNQNMITWKNRDTPQVQRLIIDWVESKTTASEQAYLGLIFRIKDRLNALNPDAERREYFYRFLNSDGQIQLEWTLNGKDNKENQFMQGLDQEFPVNVQVNGNKFIIFSKSSAAMNNHRLDKIAPGVGQAYQELKGITPQGKKPSDLIEAFDLGIVRNTEIRPNEELVPLLPKVEEILTRNIADFDRTNIRQISSVFATVKLVEAHEDQIRVWADKIGRYTLPAVSPGEQARILRGFVAVEFKNNPERNFMGDIDERIADAIIRCLDRANGNIDVRKAAEEAADKFPEFWPHSPALARVAEARAGTVQMDLGLEPLLSAAMKTDHVNGSSRKSFRFGLGIVRGIGGSATAVALIEYLNRFHEANIPYSHKFVLYFIYGSGLAAFLGPMAWRQAIVDSSLRKATLAYYKELVRLRNEEALRFRSFEQAVDALKDSKLKADFDQQLQREIDEDVTLNNKGMLQKEVSSLLHQYLDPKKEMNRIDSDYIKRETMEGILQQAHDYIEINHQSAAMALKQSPNAFPGGIDLNSTNMAMTVTKDARGGVKVDFDLALVERIRKEGIQSVVPIIINITPVGDIRPLLGLSSPSLTNP